MRRLFVDKSIEINAPASTVWDALTKPQNTDEWAAEFSNGGPRFHIQSDWKLGAVVLWKGDDENVAVEGKVTALLANTLLRFTVVDLRSKDKALTNEQDGITFELAERGGKTTLHVLQGDFSVIPEGEKYLRLSAEIWDRVLPKIRSLAETEVQPTCGKGLAENSLLPAKLGEIVAAVAENLEAHMTALDVQDQRSKQEFEAYAKLSQEYQEIARRLEIAARQMAMYRNLPMGRHDENAMSDSRVLEAFRKLTNLEQELTTLLEKRREQNKKMLAKMSVARAGR